MRVAKLLCTTILTITSIQAAALAAPDGGQGSTDGADGTTKATKHLDEAFWKFRHGGHNQCYRTGEGCAMLKRAVDIAVEALGDSPKPLSARHNFCYRLGEGCARAKREALALAMTVADAEYVAFDTAFVKPMQKRDGGEGSTDGADGTTKATKNLDEAFWKFRHGGHNQCYRTGEGCAKAKRDALAAAEAFAEAEAKANPDPEAEADIKAREAFCNEDGQPCAKLKFARAAIADLIAEPAPAVEPRQVEARQLCYSDGGACAIHKRALDSLNETLSLTL